MSPYLSIVSARFRLLLQYRAAAAAGFATQLFWGLILTSILEAFYRASGQRQPISLPQAITYVWLGQAMLGMLPWSVDPEARALVRSGAVAYELLRPLDLYGLWFSRALALRSAPTLLRAAPMFVLAIPFFGMQLPASRASLAGWILATACALLLSAAITTILSITLLWTVSGEGLVRLAPAFVILLSGLALPLPLMPGWAQETLAILPFRGVIDAPFRVYMGNIGGIAILGVLIHQLVWTALIVAAGRRMLAVAGRKLVVQGG